MALGSAIEWTDATWNPVTGCTKVSPGCKHCYAERMARRLQAMGQPRYAQGFKVTLQPDTLELPLRWRLPRTIFVNSMSDLFHPDVPENYIQRCFDIMCRASQHVFQILTKRPERVADMALRLPWAQNIWMGTSVENEDYLWRIRKLAMIDARIRFLSIEPLLGPIKLCDLDRINWVIVGGESGPGARPMREEWVTSIRDQCDAACIPFFFKQWGGVNKARAGRILEGREWNGMPKAASGE
jgi:protein gp37